MKLFLIIVGALVTAFVLCLLILFLWLRWLTRNVRRSLGKLGDVLEQARPSVPPLRIKLRRTDAIHWQRPDEVEALIEPLRQERFGEIGAFGFATDSDDVAMQAFWRPADSMYAIVYEHPRAGAWLDLVTRYQDGSRVTYSTMRETLLDRAENNLVRYHEGMPVRELLSRFLAERPSKPIAPMSAEAFAGHFEQGYADSMDWMISRGGPTEAEILRQCKQRGDIDGESTAPLVVLAVRGSWAAAIDTFYEEQLKQRFLADTQPSAARWEEIRDRLVFVHDRLSPGRLEALCEEDFDEEDDEEDDAVSAEARTAIDTLTDGSASPREAFARWNAAVGNERRYEKIGQLAQPLAADVYLSPNSDD